LTLGFLLAALSALCWSIFDATRKKLVRERSTLWVTFVLVLGQIPLFFIWMILSPDFHFSRGYLLPGALAIAANLIANVLFIKSVSIASLSITVPMLSFTPAFAAVFGFILLGEELTQLEVYGMLVLTSGGLVLANPRGINNLQDGKSMQGVLLMLIVALAWGVTIALDKLCLNYASVALHATIQCCGVVAVLYPMLRWWRKTTIFTAIEPKWLKLFLFSLVVSCLAMALQLYAIQAWKIGLVEGTKRSLGLILALVFGYLFFGEKLHLRKIIAVILMALGVWLILWQ